MDPASLLPRKYNAVASAPQQLVISNHSMKRASRPRLRLPQLPSLTSIGVGQPNRPRCLSRTHWPEPERTHRRNSNKRHLLAIRRPDRILVPVRARIEVTKRFRSKVVHADEAVVRARIHENDAGAIGRPARRTHLTLCMN